MRILSPLLLAATLSLVPLSAALAEGATLTVTGSATVETVPDLATLSLGVTTMGPTASAAMTANSEAVAAVIARLKTAGVDALDIQTSSLSLNPNWVSNSSSSANEVQGYIASNIVTIRVRAIANTGAVVDAAIADGANALNGLYFGLQNSRPAEDEARKKAVADALARANLLAEAAGVTLGPIQSIIEGGMPGPMPGPMYKMADAAAAIPVEAGSVGVTASVTLVFALDD